MEAANKVCPCCSEPSSRSLFQHKFKLCHVFIADFHSCGNCGHIWYLVDNEPLSEEYLLSYYKNKVYPKADLTTGQSQTLMSIVDILISGLNIDDSAELDVFEIGAGSGDFASAILSSKKIKVRSYFTNDPSTQELPAELTSVRTISEFSQQCDLIICRHTLEHVSDLKSFVSKLLEKTKIGGLVYVEVPCWTTPLNNSDELNAEHLHHFNHTSLDSLFFNSRQVNFVYDFSICFKGYYTPNRIIGKVYRKIFESSFQLENVSDYASAFLYRIQKSRSRLTALKQFILRNLRSGVNIGLHGATITLEDFFLNEGGELNGKVPLSLFDGVQSKIGSVCCNFVVLEPSMSAAKDLGLIVCFSSYFHEIESNWRALGFRGRFLYYVHYEAD